MHVNQALRVFTVGLAHIGAANEAPGTVVLDARSTQAVVPFVSVDRNR